MKTLKILSFLLLCFTFLNSYSQYNTDWKWIHPFPNGNTLRWVKIISPTTYYAIGYAGTFMTSTNAGSSWNVLQNAGGWQTSYAGQGRILYSGWFFNANTGLVCGSSGWIARTTNAGINWDSIASPTSNTLYGLQFINNNTGYIGGSSGTVLKTTNGGTIWIQLTTGVTSTIYNIYAVDTNYVYAPTTSGNILISTNGGSSFTSNNTGTSFTVYDANFVNASTGMVCGSSGNLVLTTNGGLNWSSVNTSYTSTFYELYSKQSLSYSQPYFEGFEHPTLFPPEGWTNYNVAGNVVWMRSYWFHTGAQSAICAFQNPGPGEDWLVTPKWSIQSGDSLVFWMRMFLTGTNPDSLVIRVSTTDSNIASFTNRILYLDVNSGYPPVPNWARFSVSLNSYAGQNIFIAFKHGDDNGEGVLIDDVSIERYTLQSPEFYVIGDPANLYKTTNLGTNWTQIPYNDPNQTWTSTYYTADFNLSDIIVGGAYGLILKSTNNGLNWTSLTNFLSPGIKYGVWAQSSSGKVIVTGAPGLSTTNDQIMMSTNGGNNWSVTATNSASTFYDIQMLNNSTGWMAGTYGAVRKTTNGGLNWDSVVTPVTSNLSLRKVRFLNSTTGWLFSFTTNPAGTIWKTTDGGNIWNQQSTGAIDGRTYAAEVVDSNVIYIGNYTPKVLKSTNGGDNWTELVNTPMGSGFIYDIKFFSPDTGYIAGTAGARLCRTLNGGVTFDTIHLPFTNSVYAIKWINYNTGWVFGANGMAIRTSNAGTSWSLYNTTGSTPYASYMSNPDSIFVVGSAGNIFKFTKQLITNITWNYEKPDKFTLNQNYPNPFNPVTTIEFTIPKPGFVNLKIYDISGKEVMNAVNANFNAGKIQYRFDGSGLASGVYFYTLVFDGKLMDTKKMILLK